MARYSDNVIDQYGNAVPGVQVTVLTEAGALATLTNDAGAALGNPVSTGAGGAFSFNAASGTYTLQFRLSASLSPFRTQTAQLALTSSDLVDFARGGTGNVSRTIAAQVKDLSVNPYEFGAVGDGSTDNLAAFNAALARIKELSVNPSTFYAGGLTLRIPPGNFRLTDTFDIKAITTIIEGHGTGQTGGAATILQFAPSKTGIRLQRFNTQGTETEAVPTKGADGTIIQNLALMSEGGAAADFHGIHMRAKSIVRECYIEGFPGHGVAIIATQGGGAASEGNANCWRLDTVHSVNNKKSGFYCDGGDSNAGLATMCNSIGNLRYGIEDSSFLGCWWIGYHTQLNILGNILCDSPNANSLFVGYSEPDEPAGSVVMPSVVLPCYQGNGIAGGGVMRVTTNLGFVFETVVSATAFGVGNRIAASGPVGAITGKTEIYNKETGASLGFLPIYGSIT